MKKAIGGALFGFVLLAPSGFSIVTPGLPPVPTSTPPSSAPAIANSPATQAMLLHLFDKSSYQDFTAQTPSITLFSEDAP